MLLRLLCCGPGKRTLYLKKEEVIQEDWDFCTLTKKKITYNQLSGLDVDRHGWCFSEIGELASPACGCFNHKPAQVVMDDLKPRIEQCGELPETKLQEEIISGILALESKVDVLTNHLEIAYPPAQEEMANMFQPLPLGVKKA